MNATRLLLFTAALSAAGCIERFPRDAQVVSARPSVDRAALRNVLVQQVPKDMVPVGALFGTSIELLGYKLEPAAIVPGQYARVWLYWRCRAEVGEAWHIFVHLDDAAGSGVRINRDHDPAEGRFPTDAWRPGDIIADPVVFAGQQNPLNLFVGFFSQGETRLTLSNPGRGRSDGNNRLLAGVLPVATAGAAAAPAQGQPQASPAVGPQPQGQPPAATQRPKGK